MDRRTEILRMTNEWASENKERAVFSMMTDEDGKIQLRLRGKGINVITSLASVMDSGEDNYQAIMNAVAIFHKKRGMKARVKLAWDILRGKLS